MRFSTGNSLNDVRLKRVELVDLERGLALKGKHDRLGLKNLANLIAENQPFLRRVKINDPLLDLNTLILRLALNEEHFILSLNKNVIPFGLDLMM